MSLHLEFLVEELSTKQALSLILPKIMGDEVSFKIHAFKGKSDLFKKLPDRLKGYQEWIDDTYKIIILVDEDREDCKQLKQQLDDIANKLGLVTKSSRTKAESFQVLNRIVVEELEAWFFGDINAICQAYPKISRDLGSKAKYRNPDTITGGTWEALEKVLQSKGYHLGGLEKNNAAREISKYMNPKTNRSKSFQVLYQGLLEIIELSN